MHGSRNLVRRCRRITCVLVLLATIILPALPATAGGSLCCSGRMCSCESCPLGAAPGGEQESCHIDSKAPMAGPQEAHGPLHQTHAHGSSDDPVPHTHLPIPSGCCSSTSNPLPVEPVSQVSDFVPEPAVRKYAKKRSRFRHQDPLTRSFRSPRGPPSVSSIPAQ